MKTIVKSLLKGWIRLRILSLDACSSSASVALLEDKNVIGEFFSNVGLTHSVTLVPMIKNMLNVCNVSLNDVDLFAVTEGPGSFTGVRIGISVIKGMSCALGIQCVGVSSLYAAAFNAVCCEENIICVCMDARRGEVYNAIFKSGPEGPLRITKDRAISIPDLISELRRINEGIIFVGDGALMCYNIIKESLGELKMSVIPEGFRHIKASHVGQAALTFLNRGKACDAGGIQPVYLRLPQAERQRKERILSEGGDTK